jgi:hypothetical protein
MQSSSALCAEDDQLGQAEDKFSSADGKQLISLPRKSARAPNPWSTATSIGQSVASKATDCLILAYIGIQRANNKN